MLLAGFAFGPSACEFACKALRIGLVEIDFFITLVQVISLLSLLVVFRSAVMSPRAGYGREYAMMMMMMIYIRL